MSVREYPDIPRIFVDMDGPTADFERGMNEHNLPASKFKLIPGTYINLHPTPGAIDAIHALMDLGFFVIMLTKIPSENPYSATEKIMWIYKHIPRIEDHIIISPDKGCVGTEHDFLIDDHPEWANAHNFVGTVVKFGGDVDIQHSHIHCPNWRTILQYFTNSRERIFEKYNRTAR
jgi:5'(3')-deoxyribonucleotidase